MSEPLHPPEVYLERISKELTVMRQMMSKSVNATAEAESEIPESMRRFANYYHDVVHIKGEYVSLGLVAPSHFDREMERCDDRFRQLLSKHHLDGGAFEKVRREMAEDPDNRWDHTRLLTKGKEAK